MIELMNWDKIKYTISNLSAETKGAIIVGVVITIMGLLIWLK
jgi:hypothetical protein